jgi:translation initiation factor IF-1
MTDIKNTDASNEDEIKQEGDILSVKGEVLEVLPNSKFKIKLPNGAIILGHSSGKMRKNRIKVLQYDVVNVEFSVFDLENLKKPNTSVNGRVTFRYKQAK